MKSTFGAADLRGPHIWTILRKGTVNSLVARKLFSLAEAGLTENRHISSIAYVDKSLKSQHIFTFLYF